MICASSLLLFACNNEKSAEVKSETGKDTSMAKTDNSDQPWTVVDSATMMQKMQEYGTPGPMHQLMASWNGTWSGESTMWEYDGAPGAKSTGTAVNKMIMGGKYQHSRHTGTMMGMPFEGESITAYDNATKQFTSTWIDTWSTGIMTMTGNWNESSKTLTMSGKYPDIFRPGRECTMRQEIKVIDDKTHQITMYGPDQKTGKEFKMFEIMAKKK
jgi:hypothetical protein